VVLDIKKVLTGVSAYENSLEKTGSKKAGKSKADESSKSCCAGSDSVRISDEARLLSVANAESRAAPDVRRERVEQLKAEVNGGTYVPDAKAVAGNLIRDDLELYF
jgi:negative regulator of flagellin synthesis FlgM